MPRLTEHGTYVRHPFSGDCGTLWVDSEGDLWLRWDTPDEDGEPVDVDPSGYALSYLGEAPRRADDISREAKALALADGWDY